MENNPESSFSRTAEDVLQLAEHAKLDPVELIPLTQTLSFSTNFGSEANLKLIEVDEELLSTLNDGDRVTIRGDEEESSVLCTNSKTYEIQEAETSNSLLLVPGLMIPKELESDSHLVKGKEVSSIHYKYYEVKHCQPRLGKLYRILEEKPYSGINSVDFGYTSKELLSRIQSSKEELFLGLKSIKAFQINGRWTLLDFDYHFSVLSSILNLIDSDSIPLHSVDKSSVLTTLRQLEPENILDQCFDYYFSLVEEPMQESCNLYKINDEDVSRFCAEVLLKPAGKFNLHEFLNIWQQSVPEGVVTHLKQLRGVALVDSASSPPVVWHFPVSSIPLNVSQAFSFLFETRSRWTLEDISPYLSAFTSPKTNVVTLLTKYARTSTVNGTKYYTSRHAT